MDNLEGLTHQTGIIGATKESFSGGLSELYHLTIYFPGKPLVNQTNRNGFQTVFQAGHTSMYKYVGYQIVGY